MTATRERFTRAYVEICSKIPSKSLRCFVFVHQNISNEQKMVQCAHAVAELFRKNPTKSELKYPCAHEWQSTSPTLIVLNGGSSADLQNVYDVGSSYHFYHCETAQNTNFAWSHFVEDGITLPMMLTSVAFIVDDRAVKAWRSAVLSDREPMDSDETPWYKLLSLLSSARLMKM